MKDCIFCQIIRGEKSAELVYQGESVVAFKDIKPHAPLHVLLVPKNHIRSINELADEDRPVISELIFRAQKIAEELGIHCSGYIVSHTGFRLTVV